MQLNEIYGGNYLVATDLQNQARRCVIEKVDVAQMQNGSGAPQSKAVLTFRGVGKGLVLNKTNASMLAASFGWNSDLWLNREIEIYPEKVSFQGKIVDSIRVRVPFQGAAAQPVAAPTPTPVAAAPLPAPVAGPAAGVVELVDDIPW